MLGPGAYVPDPTEGIVDSRHLPRPQLVAYSRHYAPTPCPRGGPLAYRHTSGQRTIHELGHGSTGCPVALLVPYSSHDCSPCRKHCNIALTAVAPPGSHSTHRVIQMAVRLVGEDGVPSRPTSGHLWREHRVFVPFATRQHWGEAGGKKGARPDGRCVAGRGA